ncbi:hypothetical protein BO70DRAFT_403252 [Aspergillus heteromorphus CBS 117.55]|uniref:Uncharacterized protein n=1 Tax=Aspergillus heteromorphus CBS 117.55 TaxID=1448321 RepID=A0A317X2U3_9EURO|nr:uncharacterized protein BO70DRAFT_403252 [Aspergillus heteromorphus CBS 117.55]PWY92873.1 hypothetical protein BO70DRAFT_403252 [Aspergillus heteromorphus CBS 117.55]
MADSTQSASPQPPSSDNASDKATAGSSVSSDDNISFKTARSVIQEDAAETASEPGLVAQVEQLRVDTPIPEISHWSSDSSSEEGNAPVPMARTRRPVPRVTAPEPEPEREFPIAVTSFIGNPRPRPDHQTQLSCVVFSAPWLESFLPENCRTTNQKSLKCKAILRFNEECLVQLAQFFCAGCTDPTPAEGFVHRPIMFTRTGMDGLEDGPRRTLMMRFGQLTRSRWNFPEMNATLGGKAEGQIFEVAIPTCGRDECNLTARTMANELINSLLPCIPRLRLATLDLGIFIPTTRVGEHEEDAGWEPSGAEVLVCKLAPDCLSLPVQQVIPDDEDEGEAAASGATETAEDDAEADDEESEGADEDAEADAEADIES